MRNQVSNGNAVPQSNAEESHVVDPDVVGPVLDTFIGSDEELAKYEERLRSKKKRKRQKKKKLDASCLKPSEDSCSEKDLDLETAKVKEALNQLQKKNNQDASCLRPSEENCSKKGLDSETAKVEEALSQPEKKKKKRKRKKRKALKNGVIDLSENREEGTSLMECSLLEGELSLPPSVNIEKNSEIPESNADMHSEEVTDKNWEHNQKCNIPSCAEKDLESVMIEEGFSKKKKRKRKRQNRNVLKNNDLVVHNDLQESNLLIESSLPDGDVSVPLPVNMCSGEESKLKEASTKISPLEETYKEENSERGNIPSDAGTNSPKEKREKQHNKGSDALENSKIAQDLHQSGGMPIPEIRNFTHNSADLRSVAVTSSTMKHEDVDNDAKVSVASVGNIITCRRNGIVKTYQRKRKYSKDTCLPTQVGESNLTREAPFCYSCEGPKLQIVGGNSLEKASVNDSNGKSVCEESKKKIKLESLMESGDSDNFGKDLSLQDISGGKPELENFSRPKDVVIGAKMQDQMHSSSLTGVKMDDVEHPLHPLRERTPTGHLKRKLLILDINGLLADIVAEVRVGRKPDIIVSRKAVFRRPFCEDFLRFCFDRFNVGVWSSRNKKNVDKVLDFLMGNLRDKLLFCWHQSHCTRTEFNTIENTEKPLVLKELKRLWEKYEPDLPWEKGDYDESNTLLLDDSPYKALRNPAHTAIFPYSYRYRDDKDYSLGPGGNLRVYLEGLAMADNVQNYVQQNPFGQRAITKSNLSWKFYQKIIESGL